MIKNYLKTAWRNLWKNKTVAMINLLGLIIGITCCLLIGIYINHELSYDKFQQKGDRIARVLMKYRFASGDAKEVAVTSTKVFPTFARNFPEVESGVRMVDARRIITVGDKQFEEPGFMYADSTFFDLFSFRLLQGDTKRALSGLNKVVLTASSAKKYFGTQNPVGQTLKLGSNAIPYEITGIIEDCPSNSQFRFDFLASFSSLRETQEKTYWNANYTTYILLKNKEGIKSLQAQLPAFMKKEMAGTEATIEFTLEPFTRIHLHSPYPAFEPNTSIVYIYILTGVAVLILFIACFTYINLSTARSLDRGKEVGIRKAVGALRNQIFGQFISESFLLSLIAVIVSIGIVVLVLPAFNHLAATELSVKAVASLPFLLLIATIVLFISLVAGSYPALVLSAFKPIKVLKGTITQTTSGAWLRKTLTVFQFVISVFLVIGALVIKQQMNYIQQKKLGYDREQVLVLPLDEKIRKNMNTFKTEFLAQPGVSSVSRCNSLPTFMASGFNMRSATMPENDNMTVTAAVIDEDFIPTMGIELVAGSNLSRQDMEEGTLDDYDKRIYHFIINESAVKELGWKSPEEAVGQKMFLDNSRPGTVKGVAKDFHFQSLHNPIKSIVLFPDTWGSFLLVKLKSTNTPQTIAALESKWKQLAPHRPFSYRFLDEDYDKMYSSETRLSKVMNLFTIIAIALACMGLFGLSYYAAQQRKKEIGVRKVLGASVLQVSVLVSKEFLRLVLVAFLIAVPATWWAMSKWLEDFVYRTSISWSLFAIAGVVVLLIAAVTVSFEAIKAALANPVKSLRSE